MFDWSASLVHHRQVDLHRLVVEDVEMISHTAVPLVAFDGSPGAGVSTGTTS